VDSCAGFAALGAGYAAWIELACAAFVCAGFAAWVLEKYANSD